MKTVGVLALQGAFKEHIELLNSIDGVNAVEVRNLETLNEVDGIILPGGESTAMGKLLRDFNLMEPLKKRIENKMPVWGTCAGMILLANKLSNDDKVHLGVMDITVKRNGYGSQIDSFIHSKKIDTISQEPIEMVFIRAPYVENVGEKVEVIAKVDGKMVACKEDNKLCTSFHPELTKDNSFHRYFVSMIK